jgi:hypothetical protein
MGLRTPNTDLAGIRGQAETYRLDAAFLGRAQYKAAEYADRRSRYFGAPAAALSAIVGTSIFATIDSQPALHWKILAGLVSLAAALLGSLQAFYRFAERAQEHRAAGAAYASLRRQLDGFLLELAATSTPGDALKKLAVFRRRF